MISFFDGRYVSDGDVFKCIFWGIGLYSVVFG